MSVNAENIEAQEKNKLNDSWALWYDYQEKKYNSNLNWSDNLKLLGEMEDVETFWGIQKEIGNAQELQISSNLHFFRKGIKPMWEDPKNMNGGKWVLEIHSDQQIQSVWTNTLLFCISEACLLKKKPKAGEKLNVTEDVIDRKMEGAVCGAVFSPRKHYFRISMWTNCKDSRAKIIGQMWQEFLDLQEPIKISFRAHESSIKSSRDIPTDIYTL